jgi:hypothetical protein
MHVSTWNTTRLFVSLNHIEYTLITLSQDLITLNRGTSYYICSGNRCRRIKKINANECREALKVFKSR